MSTSNRPWPMELPEKPEGWTKHFVCHMSFSDGGVKEWSVKDPDGRVMPFAYGYDTRPGKGKGQGFAIEGCDDWLSWDELRAFWPTWLATHAPDQKPAPEGASPEYSEALAAIAKARSAEEPTR